MTGTPLIIEAALNGQTPKSQNPGVPYADDEIVEQAVAGNDSEFTRLPGAFWPAEITGEQVMTKRVAIITDACEHLGPDLARKLAQRNPCWMANPVLGTASSSPSAAAGLIPEGAERCS